MPGIHSIGITVQVDTAFKKILTLPRQINFATATSLTKIADQSRVLAVDRLKRNFKIRGQWFKKENKYGIKIVAAQAKAKELQSEVYTRADWLEAHETDGGAEKKLANKASKSGYVAKHFAIPSDQSNQSGSLKHVPPRRTGTGAVSSLQKPGKLIAKKRNGAFAIRVRGFLLLLQRLKKKEDPVVRYAMPVKVKIKENKTLLPATETVVNNRFERVFNAEFDKAIQTARITP